MTIDNVPDLEFSNGFLDGGLFRRERPFYIEALIPKNEMDAFCSHRAWDAQCSRNHPSRPTTSPLPKLPTVRRRVVAKRGEHPLGFALSACHVGENHIGSNRWLGASQFDQFPLPHVRWITFLRTLDFRLNPSRLFNSTIPQRFYSKGQHLLPEGLCAGRTYNEAVRYYTTKRMNGGITFKCIFCEHNVATLDFDHTKGNQRTQAAAAMNQHARVHFSQLRTAAPIRA